MIKRLFVASLLVIALVIGAGYWSWPRWSPILLSSILADFGIELVRADISRPSWTSVTVKGLDLRYADSSLEARVAASHIAISYQPANLLRGRLAAIVAPDVFLDINVMPEQPRASAAQRALPVILPESLFERSPVEVLQIDKLRITSSLVEEIQELNGALRMDRNDLAITLAGRGAVELDVSLSINRDNKLVGSLEVDQEPALQLAASATANDQQQYSGRFDVELGSTLKLLRLFQPIPVDARISGQLRADWQVPLPSSAGLATVQPLHIEGQLGGAGEIHHAQLQGASQFELGSTFLVTRDQSQLGINALKMSGALTPPAALATLSTRFTGQPLQIEIHADPGMQILIDHSESLVTLDAPAGRLSLTHPAAGLDTDVELANTRLGFGDTLKGSAEFSTSVELDEASSPEYSAEQLQLSAAGTLTINSGEVTIRPGEPVLIKADKVNINNYLLDNINVTSEIKSGIVINQAASTIRSATITISDQTVTDGPLKLTIPSTVIELRDAALSFSEQAPLTAALDIRVQDMGIRHDSIELLPVNLSAKANLIANKLKGTFDAGNTNGLLNTRGEIHHDLNTGTGQLSATTDSVLLSEQTTYLPRIIKSLAQPIDATDGQFHVKTKANWSAEQTRLRADVELANIAGFYNRNLFYGLEGSLQLNSDDSGTTITSEQITIAEADAGVLVKDIRFGLAPRNESIVATDFYAELLGGKISQREFVYDWTRAENQFVINLHDIQLGEVLKLESGVIGSGSLGGQLPITLSDSGVSIEQGGISAKAPGGVLKYDSGEPLTGAVANAGLQLTLDALKNFHYNVLSAQVEYEHSGDLALKVTLEGRNPDLEEQRPFLFNLNITENIPTLLKSLQLTREISDDLDRRIKAFYNTDQQETLQ